jgi:shikimate dehydrogenase
MTTKSLLNGATRLIGILGDPIGQVKSPITVTQIMQDKGLNAVCVPLHVSVQRFDECVRSAGAVQNLDGLIATVPHKFSMRRLCASVTQRADFLGVSNVARRNPDGSWHGDMLDGEGFVAAARAAGCEPQGKRALMAGAGGAGTAIAYALLDAGVTELAVHDMDAARRDALIARLASRFAGRVRAGSSDPQGFDMIVNATPMGMQPDDPVPFDISHFTPGMFVGDVITVPEVPALLEAARAAGCLTQTGSAMSLLVCERLVAFLLEG